MEAAASHRATSQKSPTKRTSKALDLKKTEKLKGGRGAGSSALLGASILGDGGSRRLRLADGKDRLAGPAGRVRRAERPLPGHALSLRRSAASRPPAPPSLPRRRRPSNGSGDWLTRSGSPMVESESLRLGKISTSSSVSGGRGLAARGLRSSRRARCPPGRRARPSSCWPRAGASRSGLPVGAFSAPSEAGGSGFGRLFGSGPRGILSTFSLPSSTVLPMLSSSRVSKVSGAEGRFAGGRGLVRVRGLDDVLDYRATSSEAPGARDLASFGVFLRLLRLVRLLGAVLGFDRFVLVGLFFDASSSLCLFRRPLRPSSSSSSSSRPRSSSLSSSSSSLFFVSSSAPPVSSFRRSSTADRGTVLGFRLGRLDLVDQDDLFGDVLVAGLPGRPSATSSSRAISSVSSRSSCSSSSSISVSRSLAGGRALLVLGLVDRVILLFDVRVDDLLARDLLFDLFVLGEEQLRAAIVAVLVVLVDDGVAIGAAGDGHCLYYHRENGPMSIEMRDPFP